MRSGARTVGDARKWLDPVALSRLENLDLVARLVVEGFITGLHRSPYHGFSVEFAEHRAYQPGDALRYLDWRLYARSERYYVKTFMEETNLRSWLVLDGSGSMGYGSGEITKITYARQLAAALAHLMLRQRDAVGLVTFDEGVRHLMPPRSVNSWLHPLLGAMDGLEPREGTDGGTVLRELAERLDRRGLVIIFSDLLDDVERVVLGLRHLRHRKHEVIVFRILDPREVDFDFPEAARFQGMEGGEAVVQPWQVRQAYREAFTADSRTLERAAREASVDLVTLTTDTPYDAALQDYLTRRRRLV